jgi:hypothetical protein
MTCKKEDDVSLYISNGDSFVINEILNTMFCPVIEGKCIYNLLHYFNLSVKKSNLLKVILPNIENILR